MIFPQAWASFVPKVTTMFTVTKNSCLRSRCVSSPYAHQSLGYGDAIVHHDSGVQILAGVSVAFHNALGRSVVDSAGFVVNETLLEQHLRATETFGSDVSV